MIGKRTYDLALFHRLAKQLENLQDHTTVQYPVYVISRHRSEYELITRQLINEGIPHHLVIEPHDYEAYAKRYPSETLLKTPIDNIGPANVRNFCWDHAEQNGHEFHWVLDDNLVGFDQLIDGKRKRVPARNVLSIIEQTVDLFDNVAAASPSNTIWMPLQADKAPLTYNRTIASAMLQNNRTGIRFRPDTVFDADQTLRLLESGWSTLMFTHLAYAKTTTGKMTGGMTETDYQGHGRHKLMERLADDWPGVYRIRFTKDGRPQMGAPNLRKYRQHPNPRKTSPKATPDV
jgi:hypothetical protein